MVPGPALKLSGLGWRNLTQQLAFYECCFLILRRSARRAPRLGSHLMRTTVRQTLAGRAFNGEVCTCPLLDTEHVEF